jgi:hypothetical protein
MQLRHLHAVGIALLAVGMLTNVAFAAKDLKAQPFVFAGDCSVPAGDKQHGVAQWDNKVGEKDDNGNANSALRLETRLPPLCRSQQRQLIESGWILGER